LENLQFKKTTVDTKKSSVDNEAFDVFLRVEQFQIRVQLGGGRKLCLRRKQAEEKSSRILLLYTFLDFIFN